MKIITASDQSNLPQNYYTGVGSRNTPPLILNIITKLAVKLSPNYTLRSGAAQGADSAFERGAGNAIIYYADDATEDAIRLAGSYHPAWDRCSDYAKRLHGRNSLQVLGDDLKTPSGLLICWTKDGAISHHERSIDTGGTGTAISIATAYNVPVYNLQRYEHFMIATKWLNK